MEGFAKCAWSAGAMDETAAAYLHERELPYFTMFGQGSRPYKDLEGKLLNSYCFPLVPHISVLAPLTCSGAACSAWSCLREAMIDLPTHLCLECTVQDVKVLTRHAGEGQPGSQDTGV